MATIDVEIAARRYSVACRDGEEEHLRSVASIVDSKAREAGKALGSLSEARQLLFASLLLADELKEAGSGSVASPSGSPSSSPSPDPTTSAHDPAIAHALEKLAGRMEALADSLETGRPNA